MCANFKIPVRIIDAPTGQEFEAVIKDILPDIVIYQSHIKLDEKIINIVPQGVINRHPSLLPNYRGCFPIFWAKAQKDYQNMGVTLFRMKKDYDTGDILAQRSIPVGKKDSLKDIYAQTYSLGADMIVELLNNIEAQKTIKAVKQEDEGSYYGWPSVAQIVKFACCRRL